jgi:hypothetical protein
MSFCNAVKNSYNLMRQLGETLSVYSYIQRLFIKPFKKIKIQTYIYVHIASLKTFQ